VTLPGGRRLSARALNLLEDVPGILEYRVVQTEPGRFRVDLSPEPGFGDPSRQRVREAIQRGCAPDAVEVELRVVERVPRAPNGKLRAVVSEVRFPDS
jgi:hypothetical protein